MDILDKTMINLSLLGFLIIFKWQNTVYSKIVAKSNKEQQKVAKKDKIRFLSCTFEAFLEQFKNNLIKTEFVFYCCFLAWGTNHL